MSLHAPCQACERGDHANHNGRGTAPPGMIGGTACHCRGECARPAADTVPVRRVALENLLQQIHPNTDAANLVRMILEHDGETPGIVYAADQKHPFVARLCAVCWRPLDDPLHTQARHHELRIQL